MVMVMVIQGIDTDMVIQGMDMDMATGIHITGAL